MMKTILSLILGAAFVAVMLFGFTGCAWRPFQPCPVDLEEGEAPVLVAPTK